MTKLTTIGRGPDQFRIGAWNADRATAYVALPTHVDAPTPSAVRTMLDEAARRGFRSIVTAALRPDETAAFRSSGFAERERLIVLRHDLSTVPTVAGTIATTGHTRLRRPRRSQRPGVLELDRAAFSPDWALDSAGLHDALTATPRVRFRIAEANRACVGYAICGRAGSVGYIQRLAVDPNHWGRGVARLLLSDALAWVRSHGSSFVLVNTQECNHRAVALYERMGFRHEPEPMVVLERAIP
jgi:ribosomal protein S18 acetylase RimI-like enzyme